VRYGAQRILCFCLLALLAACQGPPTRRALEAGPAADAVGPALQSSLRFSRPFGSEGEVPAALVAAGPERLAALTDQAVYLLDLDGRVLARSPLPLPVRGAGGVTGLTWDGAGLGLALRWRGDAQAAAGSYLALTDEQGALTGALVPVAGVDAEPRSGFDGEAHQVAWTSGAGSALELRALRLARGGQPSTQTLVGGLSSAIALGELRARPDELELCTVEGDGSVALRRFASIVPAAATVSAPGRRGAGPCRLASSGRSWLVAWQDRAAAPDAGGPDLGLKGLAFDTPVARLVSPAGVSGDEPLRLTAQSGTMRLEAALWDGARYLVLLAAAGLRGGRLLLTVLDELGRPLQQDLFLPVEVEPAALLPAALAVSGDCFLLYGLRHPWDDGILYLARFKLEAPSGDAR
jgi:hypothetical protein